MILLIDDKYVEDWISFIRYYVAGIDYKTGQSISVEVTKDFYEMISIGVKINVEVVA
jgi:hypothetical protein